MHDNIPHRDGTGKPSPQHKLPDNLATNRCDDHPHGHIEEHGGRGGGTQLDSTPYWLWGTSTLREVNPRAGAPHGAAEHACALVSVCAFWARWCAPSGAWVCAHTNCACACLAMPGVMYMPAAPTANWRHV